MSETKPGVTLNPELLLHPEAARISLPATFQIDEIRPVRGHTRPHLTAPTLGVLSHFTGTFAGTGFNMIFRPNSAAPTTTTFPNPVSPTPPTPPSENVLELNLTKETLAFSPALGSVPNRGLEAQNDIFLNGVPYVQTISDVTNPDTGKGDGNPIGIHFEPGLWMHIPATTTTPDLATSLVRMASIPHGTTINAQCLEPAGSFNGPPTIPPVSITPFVINSNPPNLITFASQTATNNATPRIPQDLTKFIAAGTINQAILNDPNTVLRNAIAGQTITKTIVFTVSTAPAAPEFGGGTDNIAFLLGNASGGAANANAVKMAATFWIETVEHKIVIPPFKPGQPPLKIPAPAAHPEQFRPVFEVTPPHEIAKAITITVHSTQIQYSQVVLLNFAGLTWPHVSVATLVPSDTQTVPPSAWP
ncbi:MAG TPA: heme-binding protein [Rhodopila sp.]|uniref:heme-binding protein n=1 Tax=Rhodopila sp. TaxID=2480087 RepID=UPI002C4E289B|nr:heme-binding protein [Rhodopila sp.]HVY15474.1 heme-binding protein [Rhodopila sp.]